MESCDQLFNSFLHRAIVRVLQTKEIDKVILMLYNVHKVDTFCPSVEFKHNGIMLYYINSHYYLLTSVSKYKQWHSQQDQRI